MFERFTEPARLVVVVLAPDEARALGHDYLGTEHFLLGLLRLNDGIAWQALEKLGVRLEEVRAQVGLIPGRGDASSELSWTPRAMKVVELALDEADAGGQTEVGPEHILLAIAREDEGIASQILRDLGADGDAIRAAVGDLS